MRSGDGHIDVPYWGRFHYSRAEIIADGIVHAVGIVLAIAAGSALLSLAVFHAEPGEYVAAVFYVVSLLTVLSISLTYNLWPLTPAKWILRRFDHAAIYLLIAATYTPFLAQLDERARHWPAVLGENVAAYRHPLAAGRICGEVLLCRAGRREVRAFGLPRRDLVSVAARGRSRKLGWRGASGQP